MTAARRPYGLYSTQRPDEVVAVPAVDVSVWARPEPVAPPSVPRKRGRRPTPGITTGMYVDYCRGLSIEEVAEAWAAKPRAVRDRFRAMHLPVRKNARCNCRIRRNPNPVIGRTLAESNRERTRIASQAYCAEIAAVLPTVTNPRWRIVLEARVAHPEMSASELGEHLNMTRHAVGAVLRRALREAGR